MHATQATTTNYASSPTPFPRPDNKAKRHGKPKPAKFRRRADRRSRMIDECGE